MDRRCKELLHMLQIETRISCDDKRLNEFSDDRGSDTDTINILIMAGRIKQVGSGDDDNFALVYIL